jgi:hypothetical protein
MNGDICKLEANVSKLLAQVVYHGNEQRRLEDMAASVKKEFDSISADYLAPAEAQKYKAVLEHILEVLYDPSCKSYECKDIIKNIVANALEGG